MINFMIHHQSLIMIMMPYIAIPLSSWLIIGSLGPRYVNVAPVRPGLGNPAVVVVVLPVEIHRRIRSSPWDGGVAMSSNNWYIHHIPMKIIKKWGNMRNIIIIYHHISSYIIIYHHHIYIYTWISKYIWKKEMSFTGSRLITQIMGPIPVNVHSYVECSSRDVQ